MMLIERFTWLGELTYTTAILRLLMAAICGAFVGTEREVHGRAAGLRTHMMVSLGAALTTLIGVFNVDVLGITWADPMRVGAQVISGIGFLGAGTILLKKENSQITGLTTAAGLWVTAVIGLASGAGFYEGAFFTAVLATIIFTLVSKLEILMTRKRQRVFVYLEIDGVSSVNFIIDSITELVGAEDIQVTHPRSGTQGNVGVEALIRLPRKVSVSKKLKKLEKIEHVLFAIQL
jgi:putative Mg2+ transporter-C (MgtC) family protein